MIRRFLFLNEDDLNAYLSSVEGGLRSGRKRIERSNKSKTAKANLEVVGGEGEWSEGDEDETTVSDTAESRFSRLLRVMESKPEEHAWIEVFEPDAALPEMTTGQMLQWEADIFIPSFSELISAQGESRKLLELMSQLDENAEALQSFGIAPNEQVSSMAQGLPAMAGLLNGLNAQRVLVADDVDTDWKLAGVLDDQWVRDAKFDGRAVIVGKVNRKVEAGAWYPLMKLPGAGLNRDERRKLDASPKPGKENQYIEGPVVLLDLLAVFR